MREDLKDILSNLPLEELKKARLFIDLLILKIQKRNPHIEKELRLQEKAETKPGTENVRKHDRHRVKYPCQFRMTSGPKDKMFQGEVLDISAGGCQLKAHLPLRVGELVQVDMNVSGYGVKTVLGKIRWIRLDPDGDMETWLAGLEFIFDHP
jgi:hypothetical protein